MWSGPNASTAAPAAMASARSRAMLTPRQASGSGSSHWRSLKAGITTVLDQPEGFGLGNAGATASRTQVTIEAGESTYTELGVETGLAGALVFIPAGSDPASGSDSAKAGDHSPVAHLGRKRSFSSSLPYS